MTGTLAFAPLLPLPLVLALGVLACAAVLVALWRGLGGWALRGLAALVVLAALAGPRWQIEDRQSLPDIVFLAVDDSASNRLGSRAQLTAGADAQLQAALAARPNTELRRITVPDSPDDGGTALLAAVAAAMAEAPRNRIAGIIALSDGQVHDSDLGLDLPAPFHLLHSGLPGDWDRRLVVENAPAFAIMGEPVTLSLRIEDFGAAPAGDGRAQLEISVDGAPPQQFQVPLGQTLQLPIELPHAGRNVIQFSVPPAQGELTERNNTALVQINGVRDRLRVLLVSGEPHAGGRTWRNLLKSDASVDLVHFTILRPPDKQDGVPVTELSLIAFPTRELFMEKIDDFDLIIFDRYKRRGILPGVYLDNVRRYIEEGGALLVAAGPDFASADSIYRSPLAAALPAEPTARVIEQGFTPAITDLGQRHPVTAGLAPPGLPGDWGRWMRQVELTPQRGHVVMSGADDKPLLVLDRVGEGRVALLASDQAWLWDRGFEGGGPQLELLRRLAHWMMKEPDLEEEAIWAETTGQSMRIIRRSLEQGLGAVQVETPSGAVVDLPLVETRPGQFEARFDGPEIGLYRLTQGTASAVVGLGPAAPREFVETLASDQPLAAVLAAGRGGYVALADGVPQLRDVRPGRPAVGRGWIGLTPREAYETLSLRQVPLLPAWLVLLLATALITAAWLREGRRS